jgi:hypothetical protein
MKSTPEDQCRGKFIPSCYLFFAHICHPPLLTPFLFYLPGALLMRDVSHIVGMSDSPDAITQAISWAQEGLEVTNASRQSRNVECDMAFLSLMYLLASLHEVSFFFSN